MYYYFSFTFTPGLSIRHFNKKIQKSKGESQEYAKISVQNPEIKHYILL